MAALALAVKEELQAFQNAKAQLPTQPPKKRLSFDASVTVAQLQEPFQSYITFKSSKDSSHRLSIFLTACLADFHREKIFFWGGTNHGEDLYGLLAPPAHMPQKVSWHQRPVVEWMAKVAGLVYDVVILYRNTKACSLKLVAVFRALHSNGVIENKSPKGLEPLVLTFLHPF